MKLSLLIPSLGFPFLAAVACGQVQESPAATPQPTSTSTAVTPPPAPTTEPTTPPVVIPPGKIAFPQAQNSGGTIIRNPKVVPIVFQGDPNAAKIAQFHAKLAGSKYWTDVAAEYGIGAITPIEMVTIQETPPQTTTDDEIQAWLQNKLTNESVLGAPDSNTMYAIYYPQSTTILLDGEKSSPMNLRGTSKSSIRVNSRASRSATEASSLTSRKIRASTAT